MPVLERFSARSCTSQLRRKDPHEQQDRYNLPARRCVGTADCRLRADGDKDRSSPKVFVKDSAITAKVKTELAEEKLSSLVKIKVDTDNKGEVSLSGTAANQAAIDRAVVITRAVKGVTSVQNDIKIQVDK